MPATERQTNVLPAGRQRPYGHGSVDTSASRTGSTGASARIVDRRASDRYGVVFLLMLGLVVFIVAAPNATWRRAAAISMGGLSLLAAATTARARWATRQAAALIVVLTVVVVAGIISGLTPPVLTASFGAVVIGAVPLVIAGGLWRLVRERGVTLHAVAVLRSAHERHTGRPRLLQLHNANHDGIRRLLGGNPRWPCPHSHRNADRAALPGHRHRRDDRQLRRTRTLPLPLTPDRRVSWSRTRSPIRVRGPGCSSARVTLLWISAGSGDPQQPSAADRCG